MNRTNSRAAHRDRHRAGASAPQLPSHVSVRIGSAAMLGELDTVPDMVALVLFAHGSSSRHNVRSRHVARELRRHRLGTLLFDLFTETEARANGWHAGPDVDLLAQRVVQALDWVARSAALARHACSLFGTSTGAAAALVAAARRPALVSALVCPAGRVDLAAAYLPMVQAPTLLIVGGHDPAVLDVNRSALRAFHCERRLEVIPGATHLFAEPGALESVAALAAQWLEERAHRRLSV